MPEIPTVHACTHLRPLGGVQTVLRRHLRLDATVGLSSSAVLWFESGPFEPQASGRPACGLGLRWFHNGRILRRRLRQASPRSLTSQAVWAYHDLWGLPTAADLDGATRRIGVVHSNWEGSDALLSASAPVVDGMLCISAATVELARQRLPHLDAERIAWLPVPVDPPDGTVLERDRPPDDWVIGYCGRIQRHQKRVERIPEVARALRAARASHRWELLGSGPDRSLVEAGLAAAGAAARFHGVQTGDAYWRVLSGWDSILFTSDFEGLPIAMLEAMLCGVIPVFPDVPCGGRDYAARVDSNLVYAAAEPDAACRVLTWLRGLEPATRQALRTRARDVASAHTGDAYGRTFAGFVDRLTHWPRVSRQGPAARRAHPGEWLPFALLARLDPAHPWRRGYL